MEHAEALKGRQVTKYQQTYQDVPVMGGELVVDATDQGGLISMNGEISPDLALDTKPSITAAQAQQTALQSIARAHQGTATDFKASQPALWIYHSRLLEPDGTAPSLVWRMDVTSKDKSAPIRELVLVDADRGNLILNFNQDDMEWSSNPVASLDEGAPTDAPTAEGPSAMEVPTDVPGAPTEIPTEPPFSPTETATELRTVVPPLPTESIDSIAWPTTGAEPQIATTWPVYFELALDETRGWIYGSDSSGNKIDVISSSTLQLVKSFTLVNGAAPKGIALSPDGSELAIARSGTSSILFLNPDIGATIAAVIPNVGSGTNRPWDVIYGRMGRLYAAGNPGWPDPDYIHVIDTATHTEIAESSYAIHNTPRLAISADKNTLYANEVIVQGLFCKFGQVFPCSGY